MFVYITLSTKHPNGNQSLQDKDDSMVQEWTTQGLHRVVLSKPLRKVTKKQAGANSFPGP